MPSEEDAPEQPQSIASLRSKFESLAAEQKGLREKERSRPASPAPLKTAPFSVSGRTGSELQGASRPPDLGNDLTGQGGAEGGARSSLAGPRNTAGAEQRARNEHLGGALAARERGEAHPETPRARSPIPPSTPVPVGTVTVTSPAPYPSRTNAQSHATDKPQHHDGSTTEADEETGLSVKALQDRFGGSSQTQSPLSSRAPSPVPSLGRGTSIPYNGQAALNSPHNASTSTLAHMTERERLPIPIPSSRGDPGSATSEISGEDVGKGASLELPRNGSGGSEAVKLSASPQPLSALMPGPAESPQQDGWPSGAGESEYGDRAVSVSHASPPVASRPIKVPPPPPTSRHVGTASTAATVNADQPASVAACAGRRAPPPAPAPRSNALPGPNASLNNGFDGTSSGLSRASTVRGPPTAPPPALPARKMSLPPDVHLPPPIPGNRPTTTVPSTSTASSTSVESAKPILPSRPRGDTVIAPPIAVPPQLPTRSETAPADLPPPPTRSTEASGSGLTRRITRKAVPTDGGGIGRQNSLRQPVRRGSVQVPSPEDGYIPPPPPARTGGAVVPIPPRQNSKEGAKEADSDEEEPDEHVAGLTSNAKRLLDDYPDSTHANRRPPSFVPDIKISGTSHTTAFAAHGRHVCTGTHCVKVYDTLMSDQPLFVVDLKETGLDFRVKENRVTAMCFRPVNNAADEGRYLWCGTKDGHLWELDIKTGDITDTRAFVHSSAVSHIFRYKSWIMSLEEGGKLHVFQVQENRRIPQCRTIRVQERFNFVKLIRGRLWTSTGPANRSTTNAAASRGPTIRVYDPCSPGTTLSAGTTVWPSEWTGAVTSATCMPMHPGTVYLGHEGGFVSVWDAEQLACLQVFKISANDILALEGVGERLWAAGRKGMISVYDVSERPWRTTNVWTAHIEFAIHQLVVDPYSVQDTGRFILWSLAKDGLRAWDGLLSVDWVDQQMAARQIDYCSFREVRALICSWNIDSARPHDLDGTEEDQRFFPQLFASVDAPPEILVFGFQEVIPLTDKKLTAKTLIFGGKDKDSDRISGAYRQWVDKLTAVVHHAYPDTPYVRVHSENMVGLLTCVFVKADERDILRDVDVCTVKRGIGGIYGNKGAIVARLVIDDTSICFINVHLAAGQSAKAARTADLAAIMEDKAVFPASDALPYIRGGDGTAISDHEMVILNGDLNYRIDQRRENVVASISAGDLDYLLEHDQLRKEMRNNHAFRLRSFDEAPIRFEPTYKYNPGTQDYDTSEKNRIPAWCDRILHSKSDRIHVLHYRRYEPTISDHRPISAAYALRIKAVNWERMKAVREGVRGEWAKREAEVLGRIDRAYADLL